MSAETIAKFETEVREKALAMLKTYGLHKAKVTRVAYDEETQSGVTDITHKEGSKKIYFSFKYDFKTESGELVKL